MSKRKASTSLTSRRKRAKVLAEEIVDGELPDIAELESILGEFVPPATTRTKRKRAPRKPTLRTSLLKKLRARKKVLKAELRGVERDIRSLTPKRRKLN
jgi:hypothetical protein